MRYLTLSDSSNRKTLLKITWEAHNGQYKWSAFAAMLVIAFWGKVFHPFLMREKRGEEGHRWEKWNERRKGKASFSLILKKALFILEFKNQKTESSRSMRSATLFVNDAMKECFQIMRIINEKCFLEKLYFQWNPMLLLVIIIKYIILWKSF